MYIVGDEFEYEINGVTEYFTCLSEYHHNGVDYLICENEYGAKRVFYYELDEEIFLLEDEEEEEYIIDSFNEEMFKNEEKGYEYWDENEFSNYERFSEEGIEEDVLEDDIEFLDDLVDDEEIDEFLDDLFDEEDKY